MSARRINKNGGTHRILHALTITPCTSRELWNVVGAANGINKFHSDYLEKMHQDLLIIQNEGVWHITEAGRSRLQEIGVVSGMNHFKTKKQKSLFFLTERDYTATDILNAPMRPGAETYLNYPSRIGNTLIYPRKIHGR